MSAKSSPGESCFFGGLVIASCVKVPAEDDGYSPGQGAKRKPVIPRRNFDARLKIYPRIFRRTRVS